MSASHDEWLAAAQRGDVATLRRLLGGDATLLAVSTRGASSHGHSALHHAASKNHAAAVAFLLEAGADASAQNHGGSTALHSAAANGNADAARVLVAHAPAAAAARDTNGDTPLSLAAARGHDAAATSMAPWHVHARTRACTSAGSGWGPRAQQNASERCDIFSRDHTLHTLHPHTRTRAPMRM